MSGPPRAAPPTPAGTAASRAVAAARRVEAEAAAVDAVLVDDAFPEAFRRVRVEVSTHPWPIVVQVRHGLHEPWRDLALTAGHARLLAAELAARLHEMEAAGGPADAARPAAPAAAGPFGSRRR